MRIKKITIEIYKTEHDSEDTPESKTLIYEDRFWDNDMHLWPRDLKLMLGIHELIGYYNGDIDGKKK